MIEKPSKKPYFEDTIDQKKYLPHHSLQPPIEVPLLYQEVVVFDLLFS